MNLITVTAEENKRIDTEQGSRASFNLLKQIWLASQFNRNQNIQDKYIKCSTIWGWDMCGMQVEYSKSTTFNKQLIFT